MESYSIIISGKVQQVYYRKFVTQLLQKLQLQGSIENLPNGTVEVIARIYDDTYEQVIQILRDGSPLSKVNDIEVSVLEDDELIYDGFIIKS